VAVLVCSPNALLYSRVAVLASRKVGGAVQRNRCKRRLRARVRLYYPRIKPGSDILIISRPALLNAEPRDVDLAIGRLLWQAGLIEQVV
jgi:ribonuclease P protein component